MVTTTGDTNELGIDGLGLGVRIGQGGSANVYRARQEELDRDVAVKVLGGVVDEDTRRRFDRERRLMGRLSQHEGMVTVYETGFTSRNEPFIVMPLLGRSLDDEIREQPVPWERATEIIADVCRTVGFAHDQEIVHRDLKPGNIMMSTSGRPLVADFGIARIVDSRTNLEATALTLTPAYSPPEALETTVAHPSTDVYSLGATLFALITGHPPYCAPGEDRTLLTLMHCIVDDPVPLLGALAPNEIQTVLDRSMAKLPQDRYRSADEMADALESAARTAVARTTEATADTVIVAPTIDRTGTNADTRSTRRRALVAVAVCVAFLAAAAGIVVMQSGDGDDEATPAATTADRETGNAEPVDEATQNVEPVNGDSLAPVVVPAATSDIRTPAVLVVEGGEVFLLPFDEAGTDVFAVSVASDSTDALAIFVESGGVAASPEETSDSAGEPNGATTAVAGVAGTAEGVFAGTEGVAPCAPDDLIEELDPAAPETGAWADIQEIDVASIPEFVDGLTATVLAADTRITDHRFVDGEAVPSQAVLQVGTAVLIDEFGEPQVRCSSGSPLAPPEAVEGTTRYVGSAWDTFEPAATVAVVASPDPVVEFVLTDVSGGPDFIRPVGSSGAADRPLRPGEILAIGSVTSFAAADLEFLTTNEATITFPTAGGDVTGTFAWTLTFTGFDIESIGVLVGTYDPAAGTMMGTGSGTTNAENIGVGDGDGSWSATVDPAAGTIIGSLDGDASFELTFTPFVP